MARRNQSLSGNHTSGSKVGLFMSTALVSLALVGCTSSAPPAQASFAKAQAALQNGQADRAITHAEAAVLAEPRNSGYRAMLGAAYLEAGRFESASTAFGQAIDLGDSDTRTVLSLALTKVALGQNAAALTLLSDFESAIPAADLGLALALAGQPERGVHHLVNAVRNGENSAKARQNLAYAYALSGNWPAARVMAAEDVPADQLDTRLTNWAASARPEDYQSRVATLLGVSPVSDGGQPQYLALSNFPTQPMMVAEAEQMRAGELNADIAPQVADSSANPRESEAMAFGFSDMDTARTVDPTPVSGPVRVAAAPAAAPAPVSIPVAAAAPSRSGPRFVSNSVVQNVPEAVRAPTRVAPRASSRSESRVAPRVSGRAEAQVAAAAAPTRVASAAPQRRMAVATGSSATHLVQLGSFDSRAVAESKWNDLKSRWPQLADRDVVITEAVVDGTTYFRVAAAGFGRSSARSMCNSVKSSGGGCFAYAANSPPAGAVDRGIRVASRSR